MERRRTATTTPEARQWRAGVYIPGPVLAAHVRSRYRAPAHPLRRRVLDLERGRLPVNWQSTASRCCRRRWRSDMRGCRLRLRPELRGVRGPGARRRRCLQRQFWRRYIRLHALAGRRRPRCRMVVLSLWRRLWHSVRRRRGQPRIRVPERPGTLLRPAVACPWRAPGQRSLAVPKLESFERGVNRN